MYTNLSLNCFVQFAMKLNPNKKKNPWKKTMKDFVSLLWEILYSTAWGHFCLFVILLETSKCSRLIIYPKGILKMCCYTPNKLKKLNNEYLNVKRQTIQKNNLHIWNKHWWMTINLHTQHRYNNYKIGRSILCSNNTNKFGFKS